MKTTYFLLVNPGGYSVKTAGEFQRAGDAEKAAAFFPRWAVVARDYISRNDLGTDRVMKSSGFPAALLADCVFQRLALFGPWSVVADRSGKRFLCSYCGTIVDLYSSRVGAAAWYNCRAGAAGAALLV